MNTAMLDGNFVMVRADTLRLLLPQQDVGAARHLEARSGSGGRVVALSAAMEPLAALPADRFVLTHLHAGDAAHDLSFAWNEVRVLIDARLRWHPLPAAMRVTGAPFEGYVEEDGEVLLCTTAAHVVAAATAAER